MLTLKLLPTFHQFEEKAMQSHKQPRIPFTFVVLLILVYKLNDYRYIDAYHLNTKFWIFKSVGPQLIDHSIEYLFRVKIYVSFSGLV